MNPPTAAKVICFAMHSLETACCRATPTQPYSLIKVRRTNTVVSPLAMPELYATFINSDQNWERLLP